MSGTDGKHPNSVVQPPEDGRAVAGSALATAHDVVSAAEEKVEHATDLRARGYDVVVVALEQERRGNVLEQVVARRADGVANMSRHWKPRDASIGQTLPVEHGRSARIGHQDVQRWLHRSQ
jgi:hypothetical protein